MGARCGQAGQPTAGVARGHGSRLPTAFAQRQPPGLPASARAPLEPWSTGGRCRKHIQRGDIHSAARPALPDNPTLSSGWARANAARAPASRCRRDSSPEDHGPAADSGRWGSFPRTMPGPPRRVTAVAGPAACALRRRVRRGAHPPRCRCGHRARHCLWGGRRRGLTDSCARQCRGWRARCWREVAADAGVF